MTEILAGAIEPIGFRPLRDGAPVEDADPVVKIQRTSDGKWLYWATGMFGAYDGFEVFAPLDADADDLGHYVKPWDTSTITNAVAGDTYSVTIIMSSPFAAEITGEIRTALIPNVRSGLALASALTTAQTGITTLLNGVTLATGALTSTAIGSGFVAAVQSGLAAASAAATWAVTDGTMTKGAALDLLRRRVTNRRVLSALGVLSFYADNGTTVEKTSAVADVNGTAVSPATGEASQASAET